MGERVPYTHGGDCRLLAVDPDLAGALAPDVRAAALAHCRAPTILVARGSWAAERLGALPGGIGLLVVEGVLLRRVGVNGRFGAELLGAGDLLRPWQGEDGSLLGATHDWRVIQQARLAVLNEAATRRLARFPPLLGAIAGRAIGRSRRLAVTMAVMHHPRVETRVHMVLWHLATRWGRVRPDGISLPLRLSHSLIADLVAAQRPSVTVSLRHLAERGRVTSRADGWLLHGGPPAELLELQAVDLGAAAGHRDP